MPVTTSACVSDQENVLQPSEVRMMLIAGGDLRTMEETAVAVYRAGHIPILSEWLSSPLAAMGDSSNRLDAEFSPLTHPIAERLLARCDAVVRVDGRAEGADLMVALARQRGIRVFQDLTDALAG